MKKSMSRQDKLEMLDAVLDKAGTENEPVVKRFTERLHRLGLTIPGIEVRFENLRVEVDVEESKSGITTLASATLGMVHGLVGAVFPPAKASTTRTKVLINDVSGVLKPGRICLLLGPPGSGRTTFLKALAGQLRRDRHLRVSGKLTYNGLTPVSDFEVERAAMYIDQRDHHIAEMTVGESMSFASECLGPGFMRELHAHIVAAEKERGIVEPEDPEMSRLLDLAVAHENRRENVLVELYAKLMGIDHVLDTMVGDELIKGISGGQKRRLTTAELAVGLAQVMMMDEISNGLDSATTFSIVRTLASFCHYANATMLVSLLQPGPELYELFDDVAIMAGGRLVYMGPREGVLPFFAAQGLHCPPDLPAADFLQEVVNPADQHRYWRKPGSASPDAGNSGIDGAAAAPPAPRQLSRQFTRQASMKPPEGYAWIGPAALSDAFQATEHGQRLAEDLAAPPATHPLQDMVLHKRKYANGWAAQMGVVLRRETLLWKRNATFVFAAVFQALFGAFIVCTTFIRLPAKSFADANLYLSVIFFSFMMMFMGGFNYVPIYCRRLPVLYRQRNHRFYNMLAYATSSVLLRIPEVVVSAALWTVMVYFSVGFALDAGRFFIFFANLLAMGVCAGAIFQFLGAAMRSEVLAQGLGAMMLMAFINMSGFPIARPSIPGWWIWVYWFNPMSWTLKSMSISELTAPRWRVPNTLADEEPDGTGLGLGVLQYRGLYTSWAWVWAGLGYTVGSTVLLILAQAAALAYLGPLQSGFAEAEESEKHITEALFPAEPTPTAAHAHVQVPHAHAAAAANDGNGSNGSKTSKATADGELVLTVPAGAQAASAAAAAAADAGDGVAAAAAKLPVDQAGAADSVGGDIELGGSPVDWAKSKGSMTAAVANPIVMNGSGALPKSASMAAASLSFEPMVMVFRNLNYYVPAPKSKDGKDKDGNPQKRGAELQLLRDVSGAFMPGRLTALMGASGAGKTTLMDVLAGRKTEGRIEGTELVNGFPKDMRTFARISGYVEQFDVHVPQATVRESVLFSARMRLPREQQADPATLAAYCEEAMAAVELLPLSDQLVGDGPGQGLSLEARKRLTLAVELVANPSLLFLDEPTTGLDARAAAMVMRVTRSIAEAGRTVVCTIHQPSADIFGAFDDLLLLKPGGRVIFSGPLGGLGAPRLANYFAALPGIDPMPEGSNPANWMLEITAPSQEASLGVDFADLWAASALAKEEDAFRQQYEAPAPGATPVSITNTYAASLPRQTVLLAARATRTFWRMPAYSLMRYIVTLLIAVVFGSLYWERGQKRDTLLGVLDILGGIYSCVIFLGIFNAQIAMPVVVADRAVFYRERAARMYAVAPYAFSVGFAELPHLAVQSVVYCAIVYVMIGFENSGAKFGWFLLFLFLNMMAWTHFGGAMGTIMPTAPIAIAFAGLFMMFWNVFCGFLIYMKDIPGWWIWAYYFNPAQWVLYGCIGSQLGDIHDQFIDVGNGELKSVSEYVEDTFGYKYSWRGYAALIMVGLILLFRAVSYIGLARVNWSKR